MRGSGQRWPLSFFDRGLNRREGVVVEWNEVTLWKRKGWKGETEKRLKRLKGLKGEKD